MAPKSTVTLKLLVDTQAKRVVFAEAGNDFVDFLFHTLSLPLATLIALLKNPGMAGSLANLYTSVETLDDDYMLPNRKKDIVLKPPLSQPYGLRVPLLQIGNSSGRRRMYRCSNTYGHGYVTDDPTAACPSCKHKMSESVSYVTTEGGGNGEGGFVKGLVSYMVMDNLAVSPMSPVSCIGLLNKLKVKDVGSLEEKVVELGMDEAISVLKASLESDTVLSDVFLKGNTATAAASAS